MPDTTQITLRLSKKQLRDLAKLATKLALDRSQVIRLAIARLVEEEAQRPAARDKRS
jgi:predicted transcriptional regulator